MKQKSSPAVTIYEIAEFVGVSPATVSSVLANRHVERRIAKKTVEAVRDAARTLGYVPNMAGRRLRAHRAATRQFDLAIMTSFEAPLSHVGQLLHTLQSAVDRQTTKDTRFAVSIEMFHAGELQNKPALLDANRYHGVIITNTLPDDDLFLSRAKLPYPVVVLGRRLAGYHCVLEAPNYVGRKSVELLHAAGCRKLGVLHSRLLTHTTADRVNAFRRTAIELIGVEPMDLECDGLQPTAAAATLKKFFEEGGEIDGIFAVTDSLAIGAYQTLKQRGQIVPRDVAVVGVGDNEMAEYFDPPLTTVAGANDAMVSEAVPLLFSMLQDDQMQAKEILVVPPIIRRESSNRRG
jgi:LacI family transcriptional regulator